MTASFTLGRIAGIKIGVHWSVLIIFTLITAALSAGRFPAAYPGHSAWTYGVAGVGAGVVFFLGLLAHELSHALLARRNGLTVEDVTLWLFGGVARFRGEAPNPGAELRIAGVGPLVSLLLGVAFGVVAVTLAAVGQTGLLFGAVAWLAGINVLLALFNVLPAAPLDGGRLLRAALWKIRGDRQWAAVMAARAGVFLGGALIVGGLGLFLISGFGGIWLALVGWFLMSAARLEERQAQIDTALRGVRVADVMSREPETAPPDATVAEFIDRQMLTSRHSAFPLTYGGRPIGLVTLTRIQQTPPDQRSAVRLGEIACREEDVALASPNEQLTDLLPRLSRCAEGRALVVEDHQLVGIISSSDISRMVQRESLRSGVR